MKYLVFAAVAVVASFNQAQAQDAAAGEQVFRVCRACHQLGPDARNLVGPLLNGLDGRKAGTVKDFGYSDANKNSGIVWNEASFKAYIADPMGKVPGTKMQFPQGVKNPKEATDLWAYLKQFKADGSKS